jgi:hypothetical protein
MSLRRYEREVLPPLIFVVVLAASGCGGQETTRAPAPDRERGAGAATVAPTSQPAGGGRSAEDPPAEKRSPITGPRRGAIMRRLAGRRIRVGPRTVRIDPETLACGRAATKRGADQRLRIQLRCVQPTFNTGSVAGPDAIFLVRPTRAGRLVISHARLTSY